MKDADIKSFKKADDLSGYDFVHRNLSGGAETKDILKVKSKDSYRKHSRQKKTTQLLSQQILVTN